MRRYFTLVAGLFALAAGCTSPQTTGRPTSVADPAPAAGVVRAAFAQKADAPAPPAVSKGEPDLPPAKAAEACLRTAEELEKGGLEADAAGHYERARQLDPKHARVVGPRLARLYARAGDDRRAAAEFEKAAAATPADADVLNDAGYFHAARGDFAAAERVLREATRVSPAHARAWVNLGTVCAKTGRPDDARRAFGKVLTPAQAEYNLGVLLAGQGRADDARRCFEAAARDPSLTAARDRLRELDAPRPTDAR